METLFDMLDRKLVTRGGGGALDALRSLRPHFLLGGFALFTIGYLLSSGGDLVTYALGVAAVVLIQLSGGLVNDRSDAGNDTGRRTWVSGGGRAVETFGGRGAMAISVLCLLAATVLMAAVHLIVGDRPLLAPIVLLGGLGGWAYSLPPRLASTGLGEAWVAFLMGVMTPALAIYQVSGSLPSDPLPLIALWLIALQFLAGVSFPDWHDDRRTGKRNLLQRIGPRPAGALMVASVLLAYALLLASDVGLGAVNLVSSLPFLGLMAASVARMDEWGEEGARSVSGNSTLVMIAVLLASMLYLLW